MQVKKTIKVITATSLAVLMIGTVVGAAPTILSNGRLELKNGNNEEVVLDSSDISSLNVKTKNIEEEAADKLKLIAEVNNLSAKTISENSLDKEIENSLNVVNSYISRNGAGLSGVAGNSKAKNIDSAAKNLYATGYAAGSTGYITMHDYSGTEYTKDAYNAAGERTDMVYKKGMSVIKTTSDNNVRQIYVYVSDNGRPATGDFEQEVKEGRWELAPVNFLTKEQTSEFEALIGNSKVNISKISSLSWDQIQLMITAARDIEKYDIRDFGWKIGDEVYLKDTIGLCEYKFKARIIGFYQDYYANDTLLTANGGSIGSTNRGENIKAGVSYVQADSTNEDFYKYTIGGYIKSFDKDYTHGIYSEGEGLIYGGLRAPVTFEIETVFTSQNPTAKAYGNTVQLGGVDGSSVAENNVNKVWYDNNFRTLLNNNPESLGFSGFESNNLKKPLSGHNGFLADDTFKDLKSRVRPVVKATTDYNNKTRYYSADNLFLLSDYEVFGKSLSNNENKGMDSILFRTSQYSYFVNGGSAVCKSPEGPKEGSSSTSALNNYKSVKTGGYNFATDTACGYWLRSSYADKAWCAVSVTGDEFNGTSTTDSLGIVAAFCF